MLVALPPLTFLAVWAAVDARTPRLGLAWAFLRAALLAGAWMALTTEILGVADAITQPGLAIAWGLPGALAGGWLLRKHGRRALGRFASWRPGGRAEAVCLLGVLLIMLVTAVVAWATPPQTWDSLNYHMSRVAHWAQNASVQPFATGIETQNSRSPGAEFAVLHLYVLAASDRWVNFVSWGAVAGMTVAAWVLARQAGASRQGQLLSAVYVVSMPMAIVQASSTMTDSVAALWVAVAAVEGIALGETETPWTGVLWAGLAAGLALLTKPTTAPYLVPLAVWALVRLVRHQEWRRSLAAGALAVGLAAAVNAGHVARSYLLYGDPVSGGDQLEVHANQALGLDGQISNVLRNAALQLGTPSPHINRVIAYSIAQVHRLLGISPNDPRTTAHGYFKVEVPMTRENTAANPVQAYLGLFALGATFARRGTSTSLRWLSAAAIAGFWLFATLFKWQIFGSRYQLVFFVLLAPTAGAALARWAGRRSGWIAWAMIVFSLPWLLGIRSRPLLPIPGNSLVGSVLTEPRARLLLANAPYLSKPYEDMTGRIRESGCDQIGIALGGNSAEYPLWSMLDFPRTGRHIEWIVEGTPSARWLPRDFKPCAVICEGCAQDELFRGLPRTYAWSRFVLFLESPES